MVPDFLLLFDICQVLEPGDGRCQAAVGPAWLFLIDQPISMDGFEMGLFSGLFGRFHAVVVQASEVAAESSLLLVLAEQTLLYQLGHS